MFDGGVAFMADFQSLAVVALGDDSASSTAPSRSRGSPWSLERSSTLKLWLDVISTCEGIYNYVMARLVKFAAIPPGHPDAWSFGVASALLCCIMIDHAGSCSLDGGVYFKADLID